MELNKLINLVNTNFTTGGYWGVLVYDVENAPKNADEAEADLKEWLNKHEIKELKYVAIISKEKGHIFINLIANFPDRDSMERVLWEKGRSVASRLRVDAENELSGLVRYLHSREVLEILLSLDGESNDSK